MEPGKRIEPDKLHPSGSFQLLAESEKDARQKQVFEAFRDLAVVAERNRGLLKQVISFLETINSKLGPQRH